MGILQTLSLLALGVATTTASPTPFGVQSQNEYDSCANYPHQWCAELSNATDCSNPIVLVGTGCHNVAPQTVGSINVVIGSVFASHYYPDCQGYPQVLAGPLMEEEPVGCQKFSQPKGQYSWQAG